MKPQVIEIINEKNRLCIANYTDYILSFAGIGHIKDAFSEFFNSIELEFEAEIMLCEFGIFPIVCAEIMVLLHEKHVSFCHSMQSFDMTAITVESIKECLCAIKYVEINPDAISIPNRNDDENMPIENEEDGETSNYDPDHEGPRKPIIMPLPKNFDVEKLLKEINEDRNKPDQ